MNVERHFEIGRYLFRDARMKGGIVALVKEPSQFVTASGDSSKAARRRLRYCDQTPDWHLLLSHMPLVGVSGNVVRIERTIVESVNNRASELPKCR